MGRWAKVFAGLLVAVAAMATWTRVAAAIDDQNCDDFSSQQEAQNHYNADPSDPDNLDADNDGMACENFEYGGGGGGAVTTQPTSVTTTTVVSTTTAPVAATSTTVQSTMANTGPNGALTEALAGTVLVLVGMVAIAERSARSTRLRRNGWARH